MIWFKLKLVHTRLIRLPSQWLNRGQDLQQKQSREPSMWSNSAGGAKSQKAILEIQGNLTSREAEPSNSKLISPLSSYIGILNNVERSA